jgi:hypothetical protein
LFFEKKEDQESVRKEEVLTEYFLTQRGQEVLELIEILKSIYALSEIDELLEKLKSPSKRLATHEARMILSSTKAKLQALQALETAVFALLLDLPNQEILLINSKTTNY